MTAKAYFDADAPANVYDFTAYKMGKCIDIHRASGNHEAALAFEQALSLYYAGELSIEWHDGQPFAIVSTMEGAKLLQAHGGISKEDYDAAEQEFADLKAELEKIEQKELEKLHKNLLDSEKDENENPNDSE